MKKTRTGSYFVLDEFRPSRELLKCRVRRYGFIEISDIFTSIYMESKRTEKEYIISLIDKFIKNNMCKLSPNNILGNYCTINVQTEYTSRLVRNIMSNYTNNVYLTSDRVGQTRGASLYQSIDLLCRSINTKNICFPGYYIIYNINIDNTITLVCLKLERKRNEQ